MAKAKKNGVWFASLERFGYNLSVVGQTEKECRDALEKEYKRVYMDINGNSDFEDEEDKEYLETAMEEMYCDFWEFGEVQWH